MSKLPDFEGLALFARVAEERSFAGAARALGLSVATVSRAVARLEERLGARLLNRTSRQLALTEFGTSLAERAGDIFRLAEEAEGAAREQSARPRGLVRLAVPMSFGLRQVAPLLPEFFRRYPDIQIDLHLSDATVDLVGDGFDAALRIAVLPDSSLVARKLAPVSRLIVAAPAYLAQHGTPTHPADLLQHACLGYAYNARSDTWHFRNAAGEDASVRPQGPLRVTNSDALLPTVLAGLAICELPDFIAADRVRDGSLVPILADWPMTEGGLYFVTPSARARPARITVLSDFFAGHLSKAAWRP
ncbi:DNA-binding transcriptional LysR family regulator [Pseudoduganella lurida]|uniref:DNA-binding transcriptional LysR family regulator n=1 Tax=Pseudoduganella lurida TaxID=1036180 RepID=A0A562QYL2_9BURK|nr:LysR family transcriptional regulator [Pseudoduganella lurida]TWI61895.1 DNA-binding transcriptional LysR family regulator [Pseudoduganella lurida]